jgi:hypothetical protein
MAQKKINNLEREAFDLTFLSRSFKALEKKSRK